MLVKLKQCVSLNIGKALFSLFFMTLLETITVLFLLSPSVYLLKDSSVALPLILSFIAVFMSMMFQSGFGVLLLRMFRKEYVTLGYVLYGLKNRKYSVKPVLLFSTCLIVFIIAARVLTRIMTPYVAPYGQEAELAFKLIAIGILFILFCLFVLFRFIFVFLIRYDNPSLSFAKSVIKSIKMTKGRVFKFIKFVLLAGGRQLFIAVTILIISFFIPESGDDTNAIVSLSSLILEFIYFINGYSAILKMYFTVPVMYETIKMQEEQLKLAVVIKDTEE